METETTDNAMYDAVINAVCQACGITQEELTCRFRLRQFVDARHIASQLLHEQGLSYVAIGTLLKRNHATVLHSIKRYTEYYVCDTAFRNKVIIARANYKLNQPAS